MPISPSDTHDLAVIGAGPAGLAAAVTAAGFGLRVALVDAAARPGGQFYRQPAPGLGAARPEALHHSWGAFARRADRLGEQITPAGSSTSPNTMSGPSPATMRTGPCTRSPGPTARRDAPR